ncbi:hypothetical protein SEA_SENDITCS_34 [Streptomyces phage SendItCS]|nr:hypothetical protein SEA_SENDITCS_34 [Streptomyces phage SendItCS]
MGFAERFIFMVRIASVSDINEKRSKAMAKLKEAWEENPLAVIAVVGAALAGAGKFIDAVGGLQSRRAYARMHRNK